MAYCASCGGEYREGVKQCADCGGQEFVSATELKARGMIPRSEIDTRKFVRAGTAEDPLTAEQFVQGLEAAQIPVFSRPRRGGVVDEITSGLTHPWWELLVPEEFLTRAAEILQQERARIEAERPEAERAAEEEERAGEGVEVIELPRP